MYQAWLQEGTVAGAVRKLRTIEGYEDLDERTLSSVRAEKRGTEADWDERARRFHRELADRLDSQLAEEIASLNVKARKKLAKMLVKLADEASLTMPAALKKIRELIKSGDLKGQDLAYGLPKLLEAVVKAIRPAGRGGSQVTIDNRRLTLALTSPREIAQRETRKTLEADVARRERSVDLARV